MIVRRRLVTAAAALIAFGALAAGQAPTGGATPVTDSARSSEPATVTAPGFQGYTDVPADNPFEAPIHWLSYRGLTTGYLDHTFRPSATLTRQAFAALFARYATGGAALPRCPAPPVPSPFTDVTWTNAFCEAIAWMKDTGLTTGYPDGSFQPTAPMTRQALAAFLARQAAGGAPIPPCTAAPFTDVPVDHPHCPAIAWLADAGLTRGYADGTFRPASPVTRQAAASQLYQFDLIEEAGPGSLTLPALESFGACGVRPSGTVACWGGWEPDQATDLLGPFTDLAYGGELLCGLQPDGVVVCDDTADAGRSAPTGQFARFGTGSADGQVCGIRIDGSIDCWGGYSGGPWLPLPSGAFKDVSIGFDHLCGRRPDGSVLCLGSNEHGQLAAPAGAFSSVVAGVGFSCGIRPDSTLTCWGRNDRGQSQPPIGRFRAVVDAGASACGLLRSGRLSCWGPAGDDGAIWDIPDDRFVTISGGYYAACGVRVDHETRCWSTGDTVADELGLLGVPTGHTFRLARGVGVTCALHTSGEPQCWGTFSGYDTAAILRMPAVALSDIDLSELAACGVQPDRRLVCWGHTAPTPPAHAVDELALGSSVLCTITSGVATCAGDPDAAVPPAAALHGIEDDALGGDAFCALTEAGTPTCWGEAGTLQSVPTGAFVELSVGNRSSNGNPVACGLRTDETLACWGADDPLKNDVPVGTFLDVSVSDGAACAVSTIGAITCWGASPASASALPDAGFTQVVTGAQQVCGLRVDELFQCWSNQGIQALG